MQFLFKGMRLSTDPADPRIAIRQAIAKRFPYWTGIDPHLSSGANARASLEWELHEFRRIQQTHYRALRLYDFWHRANPVQYTRRPPQNDFERELEKQAEEERAWPRLWPRARPEER